MCACTIGKSPIMRISQKTIAEEAGVSRGTVDRVLHGKPSVNPETRERVLNAVKKLGYVPNEAGRALALSNREYRICAAFPDNPFFEEVKSGIKAAEGEIHSYNFSVDCISTNSLSGEELIRRLNENSYSAYMLAVGDTPEMREFIKEKIEKGVPVLTFNSDVKDSGRLCFVGQDLYKSGRIAASLMLRMLSGKEKRILVVTGSRKYHAHREREKGFAEALADSGRDFRIVGAVETEDDAELTYVRVTAALKENPELDGIYMASGDAEALAKAIRNHGTRLRAVVNDLLPATRAALLDGAFDFTILQSPFEQGYRPLKLIFECLVHGKSPENEYYYTDNTIVTEECLQ